MTKKLSEPEIEEVDYYMGNLEPNPHLDQITEEWIANNKKRPEYPQESEIALRILTSTGIIPGQPIDARRFVSVNSTETTAEWND